MRALDCETQRNAAMAEQSSAASVELLRNAKDLNVHVALFQCQEPATPARLRRAA